MRSIVFVAMLLTLSACGNIDEGDNSPTWEEASPSPSPEQGPIKDNRGTPMIRGGMLPGRATPTEVPDMRRDGDAA